MKRLDLRVTNNTIKTLLILCIIVVSDDTLIFGTNSNLIFETIKYVVLISIFLMLAFNQIGLLNLHKVKQSMVCCVAMCILVLASGLINGDLRTGYFYKCVILLLSYEVASDMGLEDFARIYEKIVYFFAIISVVLTLIAEIRLSLFSVFPRFYNSAGTSFYNMGVYLVPTSVGLLRNYGIFREPGVYQMFLMLGLIFHVYYSHSVKAYRVITYVLAIVLTFSTTGYIALAIFFVLYLFKENISFSEQKRKYFIICALILVTLFLATKTDLLSSEGMIFNKFSNTKRTTTIARSASVFSNLKIWLNYPIFGAGLIKVSEKFPQLAFEMFGKAVTHNTNTLLCELATYGIIYTLLLTYSYWKFSVRLTNKKIQRFLILVIVFVLSCGEKLTFSPIIYILAFYGLTDGGKTSIRAENEDKL